MEILATIITTTGMPIPIAILCAILIGAYMFSLTWAILQFVTTRKKGILLAIVCGCVFAGFWGAVFLGTPKKEIVQYKVTIDETVSFVEFHKKYEIIDQEGEIYTIQEKYNDEDK